MLACDHSQFVRYLAEVLILAEHERDVEGTLVSQSHDVESDADVDALFLAHEKRMLPTVRQANGLVPMSERARVRDHPLAAHLRELGRPERFQNASSLGAGTPVYSRVDSTDHMRPLQMVCASFRGSKFGWRYPNASFAA